MLEQIPLRRLWWTMASGVGAEEATLTLRVIVLLHQSASHLSLERLWNCWAEAHEVYEMKAEKPKQKTKSNQRKRYKWVNQDSISFDSKISANPSEKWNMMNDVVLITRKEVDLHLFLVLNYKL